MKTSIDNGAAQQKTMKFLDYMELLCDDLSFDDTALENIRLNIVTTQVNLIETYMFQVNFSPGNATEYMPCKLYLFENMVIIAIPCGLSAGSALSWISTLYVQNQEIHQPRTTYKMAELIDIMRCSLRIEDKTIKLIFPVRMSEKLQNCDKEYKRTNIRRLNLFSFDADQPTIRFFLKTKGLIQSQIHIELERYKAYHYSSKEIAVASNNTLVLQNIETKGEDETTGNARKVFSERRSAWKIRNLTCAMRSLDQRSSMSQPKVIGSSCGLTLLDLENHYLISQKTSSQIYRSKNFQVEFHDGTIGFTLTSSPKTGVIVRRVIDGSSASKAGVLSGDRVIAIGTVPELDFISVENTAEWQSVKDTIKTSKRPFMIRFERFLHTFNKSSDNQMRKWANKRMRRAEASDADIFLVGSHSDKKTSARKERAMKDTAENKINRLFELKSNMNLTAAERNAVCTMEEIWKSEREYMGDLSVLKLNYIIPLQRMMCRIKCKEDIEGSSICEHGFLRSQCSRFSKEIHRVVPKEDLNILFSNSETLLRVNNELLKQIEFGLTNLPASNPSESVINIAGVFGPAFKKTMPFFKIYGIYCHQYYKAIDHLNSLRKNNLKFNAALNSRESKSDIALQSLLIRPIQRLCRYPLFVTRLLRNLKDFAQNTAYGPILELEDACKATKKLASEVNAVVKDHEMSGKLLAVYHELGGEENVPFLITPHRKFVMRSDILYHEAPYDESPSLHTLFLFSDLIVLSENSHGSDAQGFNNPDAQDFSKSRYSLLGRSSQKTNQNSLNRGYNKKSILTISRTFQLWCGKFKLLEEKCNDVQSGMELKLVDFCEEIILEPNLTTMSSVRFWFTSKKYCKQFFESLNQNVTGLKNSYEATLRAKTGLRLKSKSSSNAHSDLE